MSDWIRADRWRTELASTASAVPIDLAAEFGIALLGELAKRGTPHGALSPEVISVRREGSALRVRIDVSPKDPTQETLLATGSRSMSAHPGVHYRANEQFTSDWFDARADCFAVGVMLYEFVAGTLPFGQGLTGSFQVFLKLKRGGFPPLREFHRDIPEAFAAAIVRALALRPDERFDGVAAMASALHAFVRVPVGAPIALGAKVVPPAPTTPPVRPVSNSSGVPLDPLRPLNTETLPVATQAAIAAFRSSGAPTPSATEPSAPASKPTADSRQPQGPSGLTEVPLPIRAIVEAVTRPEPMPTPSRPVPRVEPPAPTAPPSTPVTRPPIVMAPPRVAPRFGPQTDPFETPSRPERTQVTGPPPEMERKLVPAAPATRPVEPLHITPAAPSGIPESLRMPPAPAPMPAAPRTLPPPAPPPRPRTITAPASPIAAPAPLVTPMASPVVPRQTAPLSSAPVRAPTSEAPTVVTTQPTAPSRQPQVLPSPTRPPAASAAPTPVALPPAEPLANATVVAPAPLQEQLLARATDPEVPVPPAEDTARRSAEEITPPEGNSNEPPRPPLRGKDAAIIGVVLLLLGAGAGLLVQLPSRAVKQAAAVECVPGPEKICPPPPEPVALPEPTPPAPVQCVPPKPSPKLTCFYDGLRDGQARYLRGDRPGALEAFQAAERCMPRNPALLKWIGRCHEDLRDREEARTYYDRYLRRRPRADDADFYREKVQRLSAAPDGGTR